MVSQDQDRDLVAAPVQTIDGAEQRGLAVEYVWVQQRSADACVARDREVDIGCGPGERDTQPALLERGGQVADRGGDDRVGAELVVRYQDRVVLVVLHQASICFTNVSFFHPGLRKRANRNGGIASSAVNRTIMQT